jgi:hypothetical protein
LIELGGDRPNDYIVKHSESMICLIASKAKQKEATRNRDMHALIIAPSHSSHDGELGAARRLVNSLYHYSQHFFLYVSSFGFFSYTIVELKTLSITTSKFCFFSKCVNLPSLLVKLVLKYTSQECNVQENELG